MPGPGEVCGDLEEDYLSHIGDIIFALLPAGSVSGAPPLANPLRRVTSLSSH